MQCLIEFFKAPNTAAIKSTTVTIVAGTDHTDARGTGRMMTVSPRMLEPGGGWNIGRWRVRGKPGEQR